MSALSVFIHCGQQTPQHDNQLRLPQATAFITENTAGQMNYERRRTKDNVLLAYESTLQSPHISSH